MENMGFTSAIVGMGPQGRRHLSAYQQLECIDTVMVCDTSSSALKDLPTGIKSYRNLSEMLNEDIDIISISTPADFRTNIVRRVADAGITKIVIEKPIASNLKDADEILQICREYQINLSVNHGRRWSKLHLKPIVY